MRAVLVAVAGAPPKRFSGGGYCLLDYEAKGRSKPLLVVIDGKSKPFRTELTDAQYLAVRSLGDEYLGRNPRSIV
jgi:hypothetical protein